MNKYLKSFLQRGLAFGGFGPIIAGIVLCIISLCVDGFSLGGGQVLTAILSTYILAFLQAGASVFNQIDEWPVAKSLLCHFLTIYVAYVGCYLINSWIPFEPAVVGVFTAIFTAAYLVIWLTVFFIVKATGNKLNAQLK